VPLRIGVVGCSWVGKTTGESAILADGVELAAVADLDRELADEVASELGVEKAYGRHTELLEDPDIDAVAVCVSTPFHREVAVDALNAGKHVMVEKPPALFADHVREMAEAAEANDRVLSFNYQRRHNAMYRKARELIAEGKIGTVYHARAAWMVSTWPGGKREWLLRWDTKGGTLNNLASHYLDLVWFLMGSPSPQWALGVAHSEFSRQLVPDGPGDDYFAGLVGCEGGITIVVEGAYRLHRPTDTTCYGEVYGTEGSFIDSSFHFRPEDRQQEPVQEPVECESDTRPMADFVRQIEHFARAVRGEVPVESPPAEAYRFQCMLDALYESAETNEKIEIKGADL